MDSSLLHVVAVVAALVAAGRFSTFARLARVFPAGSRPAGQRFRFETAQLGPLTWTYSLDLTVAPAGLFLAPIPPFRFFLPTSFLPWDRVAIMQDNPYFVDRVSVSVPSQGFKATFWGRSGAAIVNAHVAATGSRPNNSSKPTPLRGAA
ncbi:hypothetical protein GCM10027188_28910 [Lysobacter humi (ex Lee et al. 2017)]